jgi:hypothetical protein
MVHRGIVKTALQGDAVRDGAKSAVRGGIGVRKERVGVVDVAKRPGARGDGACLSMIRRP